MAMTEAQMRALARQAAQREGLDPVWFEAQLDQESEYNPAAVSKAGARGVAQFMPATAKEFGIDPNKPEEAIPAAARYMAQLKKRFGDEQTARLAYNWGQGNVSSFRETGKGAKGQPLPKEAAEYNAKVASRIPGGATVATQSTKRKGLAPDVALALTEVDSGQPPGAMLAPPAPAASNVPGDWMGYLKGLVSEAPAMSSPQDSTDVLAQLQSQASSDQDRVLASAFGDTALPDLPGTGSIPAAVDRYLDRILAG